MTLKEILIFAGTTEGRRLSECLADAGIRHTVCVATEYGEIVQKEHPLVSVHCGRMDREEIHAFLKAQDYAAVVDATHPYAKIVTDNIKAALSGMDIPYFRLRREFGKESGYENITYFESNEACADALKQMPGNILLTTGSKELPVYAGVTELKDRLYVRVLPGLESIGICMEQGIAGKQILALQGPFTAEMNEAMIRQYQIGCLVTKQSGRAGGFQEKLEAAKNADIPVYTIGRAEEPEGSSFTEVCRSIEAICGVSVMAQPQFHIVLAGTGMGSRGSLTREVSEAIENADILLGAARLIEEYQPRLEKMPFYSADRIIPYLMELQETEICTDKRNVVILFSGDSGFYSGCQALCQALQNEVAAGQLRASICVLPGISSVAYFAACTKESYQDAAIYSIHGKELPNLAEKIRHEKKVFLLMSGARDVRKLGGLLCAHGLNDCEVVAGYQLSYPQQEIKTLTPEACKKVNEEGLYICLIKNPNAKPKALTHGWADETFIRGKVPMTKEEVREVSICKLGLYKGAVVYDIGSGTGSIAMEMAGLSDDVTVFAIEKKPEAVSLIEENKARFGLENIKVIQADAPDGLLELPRATHAFIGGSGGNLEAILQTLYEINPRMRVVLNAITVETICKIQELLAQYPVAHEEMVQLQISRTKVAGRYHLMQAENPVWVCAFTFCEQ